MTDMKDTKDNTRQNLTISLERNTILKAKILAARRSTSISGLLAQRVRRLVCGKARKKPTNAPRGRQSRCLSRAFTWAASFAPAVMNSMSGKTFVDTNILIYAHDVDAVCATSYTASAVLREL